MNFFYFDASALVKRYLTETGSAWVNRVTDPSTGNAILLAEITRVEVAAALAARHRAPRGITRAERDGLIRLLSRHCMSEYSLIVASPHILDRAVSLTQNHRLRGYDAVQLATALAANDSLVTASLSSLTFVAADGDLITAARIEGLTAENPKLYP